MQGNEANKRDEHFAGVERSRGGYIGVYATGDNIETDVIQYSASTEYNHYKLIAHGETIQIQINGEGIVTKEVGNWATGECWICIGGWYTNAKGIIKNLRVKPYTEV